MNRNDPRRDSTNNSRPKSRAVVFLVAAFATLATLAVYVVQRPNIPPATEPATVLPPTSVGTIHITRPLDVQAVDVERKEWPTEVLTDRIDHQLKLLAAQMQESSSISVESLRSFVSDTVTTTPLVPKSITTCYQDDQLRVDRVASSRIGAPEQFSGLDSFVNGLSQITNPLPDSTVTHVKFKTVGISIEGDTVESSVLLSLHGQADDQRWQQHFHWNCQWTAEEHPILTRVECPPDHFERVVYRHPRPIFSDQTDELLGSHDCFVRQLRQDTNYWLSRLESAYGVDLHGSHGISIADVDGDGMDDVYVCQPGGLPNRLFIASTNGGVVEAAAKFGLDFCDPTRSSLFVDLDNDGDQDVALVTANEVVILENSQSKEFLIRERIVVRDSPTAVLAADYNNDGRLDLYVLNHSAHDRAAAKHGILGTPVPFHDANNGGANLLLRNAGNFAFDDVTTEVALQTNNQRFTLAGSFEDYDNDGDVDLYVANDFGRNNLYRNDGNQFTDVAAALGVEDLSAGMSVSWGDVNNDSRQDIYVSNMFSSAGHRIAYQRNFHESETSDIRSGFQRHARGNSLFLQIDRAKFQDVSDDWNVTMGRWAWSSKLADINNDGFQDILITNGFVTNEDTNDL